MSASSYGKRHLLQFFLGLWQATQKSKDDPGSRFDLNSDLADFLSVDYPAAVRAEAGAGPVYITSSSVAM